MKVASPFQKKAKGKKRKFLSQLSNSWGVVSRVVSQNQIISVGGEVQSNMCMYVYIYIYMYIPIHIGALIFKLRAHPQINSVYVDESYRTIGRFSHKPLYFRYL